MDNYATTTHADHARGADDGTRYCAQVLSEAGLRLTRQRLLLGRLLFLGGHRHITAEQLHDEAMAADKRMSLATIYNTLNQFTEAGLLRRIAADGMKSFFDTDTSLHPHFYLEAEDRLVDVTAGWPSTTRRRRFRATRSRGSTSSSACAGRPRSAAARVVPDWSPTPSLTRAVRHDGSAISR